jgi:hypothetical protein
MLRPSQWALKREDALDVLARLVAALEALPWLKPMERP